MEYLKYVGILWIAIEGFMSREYLRHLKSEGLASLLVLTLTAIAIGSSTLIPDQILEYMGATYLCGLTLIFIITLLIPFDDEGHGKLWLSWLFAWKSLSPTFLMGLVYAMTPYGSNRIWEREVSEFKEALGGNFVDVTSSCVIEVKDKNN